MDPLWSVGIAGRSVGVRMALGPFQRTERTAILLASLVGAGAGYMNALPCGCAVIAVGSAASVVARCRSAGAPRMQTSSAVCPRTRTPGSSRCTASIVHSPRARRTAEAGDSVPLSSLPFVAGGLLAPRPPCGGVSSHIGSRSSRRRWQRHGDAAIVRREDEGRERARSIEAMRGRAADVGRSPGF